MQWRPALVLLAACYAPDPQAGARCSNGACPAPLVCSPATDTCEHEPSSLIDGGAQSRFDAGVDGCTPAPELCGDGIDQDCDDSDPACVVNDGPAGAVDVSAGGMFAVDLAFARDDVDGDTCAGAGGRDVFYTVTLSSPRVYYFDTFGASFDTMLRVFAGSCASVTSSLTPLTCANDACGGTQTQLAVSLPAGTSCIAIDQASSAETSGNLVLEVVAGSRNGMPLPAGMQQLTGNTSSSSNVMDPVDVNCDEPGSGGKDLAYYFTLCPAQSLLLDAETCTGATWDTVLYVRRGNATQVGCNDDACNGLQTRIANVSITGGDFFWLVIDGYDATQSGAYTLRTNLR